jgi:hypothetical protein
MYHIHANPKVLERLLEELTTAIPNATTPPSMKSLEKLPYLVGRSQVICSQLDGR